MLESDSACIILEPRYLAERRPMQHPELHQRIHDSFMRQGMMQHLGARLVLVKPGMVELSLPYSERVTQQQGGYHGGAMGALADIAGGYAALMLQTIAVVQKRY